MENMRSYAFANCVLIIGDFDISAGGGDGGIEEEPGADKFLPGVAINGLAWVSESHNDSTTWTITCKANSRAARDLDIILEEQRAESAAGKIEPRSFLLRDPSNGEESRDQYCVVLSKPGMNKGAEMADVQYKVWCPYAHRAGKAQRAPDIT